MKDLNYYLGLRYPVTLVEAEEGGFVAKIKDLPGCIAQGETLQETWNNIQEVRQLWLETAHDHHKNIKEPSDDQT